MARDYAATIAGLLANAEDEALTEEARGAYRAKAEAMMREYRVSEEEALATDPGSILPMAKTIVLRKADAPVSDFSSRSYTIISMIARHCEVRVHTSYNSQHDMVATLVGYEGDVRYAEFLWTAAWLMFSTRIDPSWSADRTEAENIFLLRQAGIGRKHIADAAWGNGDEAAARSKVQRIYIRECARRNEEPLAVGLGFSGSTYREQYADAFQATLNRRLREARYAADAAGGVVTLHGRMDRVDEAFYMMFPALRPTPQAMEQVDEWVDPRLDCAKCKKAKSGACNDHGWLRARAWTQADERRHQTKLYGASARAGRSAGTGAAEGVVIARGARTGRLDASGNSIEG